jgi:two-component system sensor histidine kinase HydH
VPGQWLSAQRVRLEIEDTGGGIPVARVGQVFNPFFTTKPSGTGLGLAIVHKIVEDHAGGIAFRAAAGGGTVFTVLLPVLGARQPDRGDERRPPLGLPGLFP